MAGRERSGSKVCCRREKSYVLGLLQDGVVVLERGRGVLEEGVTVGCDGRMRY